MSRSPRVRLIEAEAAGFDAAMRADHFSPWSERQGESGFAWAWLGAALGATSPRSCGRCPRSRRC